MSVAYGWLFGFWRALVLVNSATAGATIAFLLSRYLLGQWIQARYGQRLMAINMAIDREGAFYLFTLRLIPQVPFFVLNAVMGLTRIRVWTFWWVSQLGMLPATIVFVLAGAEVAAATDDRRARPLQPSRLAADGGAGAAWRATAGDQVGNWLVPRPASDVIFRVAVGRLQLGGQRCPPAAIKPAADCSKQGG